MISEITEQKETIAELCHQYRVRQLEVFGSGADGTFDPARSDIDFRVEYMPLQPDEHDEAYFGLLEDLEALFHRKVDLVEAGAMRHRLVHGYDEINWERVWETVVDDVPRLSSVLAPLLPEQESEF